MTFTIAGVDVSLNQRRGLPWPAWVKQGLKVAVVRLALPYMADHGGPVHLAEAQAGGVALIGAYADIYDHDAEVRHYDPVRQCKVFLELLANPALRGIVRFAMLDAEVSGLNPAEMTAWCDYYDAHGWLELILYGNTRLEEFCGINNPRFSKYGVLVSDYGFVDLKTDRRTSPPPGNLPRVPRVGHPIGWQWGGDNALWPPHEGAIDRSLWSAEWYAHMTNPTPTFTPNHIQLGPHHMQGGNATGKWLKLLPRVAKFETTDLGASVEALPGTLTLGRANDFGHLGGQGFDPNRQRLAQTPAQALDQYRAFLQPYIDSNARIQAWEGPNEPVLRSSDKESTDPAVKAAYDEDRKQTMHWYAEFCYLFAEWLHGQGKIAVIGSWASGQPRVEDNAWQHWGRALQASRDFGALQAFHDYAGDISLARVKYNNAEWSKLGYPNLRQVITELGVNEYGGGWKSLYADWSDCYARLIRPWLDAVYALPMEVDATWFTDGTGGNLAWDGLDVSGTNVVELLAGYQAPPKEDTMPISKLQQAAYLQNLDDARHDLDLAAAQVATTRAAIAALTPDDAPAKHTMATLTNQSVINLFAKVLSVAVLEAQLTPAQDLRLSGQRQALYTGPAVEDMPLLTAAQKAQVIAALAAG
jgi:hypothetical protein